MVEASNRVHPPDWLRRNYAERQEVKFSSEDKPYVGYVARPTRPDDRRPVAFMTGNDKSARNIAATIGGKIMSCYPRELLVEVHQATREEFIEVSMGLMRRKVRIVDSVVDQFPELRAYAKQIDWH